MSAELWVAIVSAAIGLVSVAVAIWTVRTQRRPKQLDYRIVSSAGLLARSTEGLPRPLTIRYGNVPVREPWLTTVRVINTGKRAIVADDYVESIQVQYAKNWPFQCSLTDESRRGLIPPEVPLWRIEAVTGEPEWPIGFVDARPPLMNPGEWFELQLFSDGKPGGITVSSVFPEQAHPMRPVSDRTAGPSRRNEVAALIAAGGLSFGIGTVASALGEEPETIMIPVVAVLLSVAVATGLWRTGRKDLPG